MQVDWRGSTWKQYGAAIDMLGDVINLCPDHLWTVAVYADPEDERFGQFWFIAYHTLRWLDLFLTGTREGFTPPSPFIVGALPERPYTKDQILAYLGACRKKCQSTIEAQQTRERNNVAYSSGWNLASWSFSCTVCDMFRNMLRS